MNGQNSGRITVGRTQPPSIRPIGGVRRAASVFIDLIIFSGVWIAFWQFHFSQPVQYPLLFLFCVLYETLTEASPMQATVGKKLFGLHITDLSGSRLPFSKTLLRCILKYLFVLPAAAVTPVYSVLALAVLDGAFVLGGPKRALHDLASRSVVTDRSLMFRVNPIKTALEPANNASGVLCASGYWKNRFFPISQAKTIFGRDPQNCHIVFPRDARGVSAVHCQLLWDESSKTMIVQDLGSTYGTALYNGTVLKEGKMAVLREGQSFCIGENNRFVVGIRECGRRE